MTSQAAQNPITHEVFSRLDALAAKLNVAADHLYGVYVAQARVEVVERLLLFVTASIALAIIWRGREYLQELFDEGGAEFVLIIGGILVVLVSVGAIAMLFNLPTLLLNPEFWAIQKIAEALGAK